MLFKTNQSSNRILFHNQTPLTNRNGLRQNGPAKDSTPPNVSSTIKSGPSKHQFSTVTKRSTNRLTAVSTPGTFNPNIGIGRGRTGERSNTVPQNLNRNDLRVKTAGLFNSAPPAPLNRPLGTSVTGLSGLAPSPRRRKLSVTINPKNPAPYLSRFYPSGLGAPDLTALNLPNKSTLDLNAIVTSPLSGAGTYGEGGVMDALQRMRLVQDEYNAGRLDQATAEKVVKSLVPQTVKRVEGIASGGSDGATAVNWIWGAIQSEGFVAAENGQWVGHLPLSVNRQPFVMPIKSSGSFFKNPVQSVVSVAAKAATGGLTLVTETGVVGKDAEKIGKKAETVAAGVLGGVAAGAVTLNPVGVVVGGAAGGIKGVVDATQTGGGGDSVKTLYQAVPFAAGAAILAAGTDTAVKNAKAQSAAEANPNAIDAMGNETAPVGYVAPTNIGSASSTAADAVAAMPDSPIGGSAALSAIGLIPPTNALDSVVNMARSGVNTASQIATLTQMARGQTSVDGTPLSGAPDATISAPVSATPKILLASGIVLAALFFMKKR